MIITRNIFNNLELDIINNDLSEKLKSDKWNLTNNYLDSMKSMYDIGHSGKKEVNLLYPKDYGNISWQPVSKDVLLIIKKVLKHLDDRCRTQNFNALYQRFDKNAGCTFHKDRFSFSATIYLNKIWDLNWGGFYIYDDNGKYEIIIPKYNTCVFNVIETDVNHCVSTVTPLAEEPRYTLQVFGKD